MANKKANWEKEEETRFENVKEEFKNSKHKKGFRLIVKDIETGSIIMNEAIDVLLGAWAKKVPDGVIGAATIVSSCSTHTLVSAIENAEKAVEQAKESVVKELLSELGGQR